MKGTISVAYDHSIYPDTRKIMLAFWSNYLVLRDLFVKRIQEIPRLVITLSI